MDNISIEVTEDQYYAIAVLVASELMMLRERQSNTASGIWDDKIQALLALQEAVRASRWKK